MSERPRLSAGPLVQLDVRAQNIRPKKRTREQQVDHPTTARHQPTTPTDRTAATTTTSPIPGSSSICLLLLVSLARLSEAQQPLQLPFPAPLAPLPPPPRESSSSTSLHHLEPPLGPHQQQQQQPPVQGPDGMDLVAFNRRRFELDHQHHQRQTLGLLASGRDQEELSLRRGDQIEAQLAAIPERLLGQLPDSMTKQLFESISADPALMLPHDRDQDQDPGRQGPEDPDGASIERLTKSCLTVHASSATPEQLNVTFQLYTRKNPRAAYLLGPQVGRLELLRATPFDPRLPTKWITHGFHTNLDKSEWMLEAKDKILAHEAANVILTDWRRGASPALAFYPKAAANAHIVAKMIVKILRRLRADLDLSRVHLIGHSLGAHIMGFVGSAFTEEYLQLQQQRLAAAATAAAGQRQNPALLAASGHLPAPGEALSQLIGRITACDPALPCFGPSSSAPNSRLKAPASGAGEEPAQQQQQAPSIVSDWTPTMWTHLRPDSAIVVEVMHSNPGVMGYADPLGDFDFYPNGLNAQPGCGGAGPAASKRSLDAPAGEPPSDLASPTKHKRQLGKTLDRFIKPIRDFFSGNSCSHHRSVEYMVESLYYEHHERQDQRQVPSSSASSSSTSNVCQMIGYRCSDYQSFKRGFCFRCQNEYDCRAFSMPVNSLPTSDIGYTQLLAMQYSAGAGAGAGTPTRGPRPGPAPRSLKWPVGAGASEAHDDADDDDAGDRGDQELWWLMEKFNRRLFREERDDRLQQQQAQPTDKTKRVLPSFNQYQQNYRQLRRNQYYFDTRPAGPHYCLFHYQLHVRYRWFRVRESLALDGFRLVGQLAVLEHQAAPASRPTAGRAAAATGGAGHPREPAPLQLHRFTMNSYTLLLTTQLHLGPIESLLVFGSSGLKASLVDHIEVNYLSHLDAQVRASNSARLCRVAGGGGGHSSPVGPNVNELFLQDGGSPTSRPQVSSVFVRCSTPLVR